MNDKLKERVEREREFHNQEKDVSKKALDFKKLFKHYFKNPALLEMEDLFKNAKNIRNKRVLDLGCGYGEDSFDLISRDNNVTGVDISDLYINFCNNYSKKNYPDKNFKFLTMDSHNLKFDDESFDLVIGRGILHHLDFNIALKEVNRVLKKGGAAYFQEPLGVNPMLKFFRLITPHLRTKDERPFYKKDLVDLEKKFSVQFYFFGMFSFVASVLTSPFTKNPNNFLVKSLNFFEKKLIQSNYFKYFAHYFILKISKP